MYIFSLPAGVQNSTDILKCTRDSCLSEFLIFKKFTFFPSVCFSCFVQHWFVTFSVIFRVHLQYWFSLLYHQLFSDRIKSSYFDFKTLNSQTWLYSSLQRLRSLYFLLSHGNSLDIARHLDKGALFRMAGAWNTGNTGQCNAFYVLCTGQFIMH